MFFSVFVFDVASFFVCLVLIEYVVCSVLIEDVQRFEPQVGCSQCSRNVLIIIINRGITRKLLLSVEIPLCE